MKLKQPINKKLPQKGVRRSRPSGSCWQDPHRGWAGGAACFKHDVACGPASSDGDAEMKADTGDGDAERKADAADGSDNDADDVEDRLVALWHAER